MTDDEVTKTLGEADPAQPEPAPEPDPEPQADPEPAADPEPGEADDDPGFDEDDEGEGDPQADEADDDETFEALREASRRPKAKAKAKAHNVVSLRDANGRVYPARPSPPKPPPQQDAKSKAFILEPPAPGETRYMFPSAGNEPRQGPTAVRKLKRERAAAEAMQLYYDVLTNPKASAMLRMMAADRLLDRIEGKPVSRTAPKGKVETVDEMRELDPKLMTEAERDQVRALCERQLASRTSPRR